MDKAHEKKDDRQYGRDHEEDANDSRDGSCRCAERRLDAGEAGALLSSSRF
jgi:hypothetical protein